MTQPEQHSRLPGFFAKSPEERRALIAERAQLSAQEMARFEAHNGLSADDADQMVENAVGVFGLPLAIAANFVVDGESVLVPMATEEPSIVAAASHMAKLVAQNGGFVTRVDASLMIGQIQLVGLADIDASMAAIAEAKVGLIAKANEVLASLEKRGGGCKDLRMRVLPARLDGDAPFLMVELIVDCQDAMGANLINTALEFISDEVGRIAAGQVVFRILSNLSDLRLARASCELPFRALSSDSEGDNGKAVAQNICLGYELAMRDPYRAATHNKGIMNGVDAVVIATGNDFRAIEAGAHSFASRTGHYQSLSHYEIDDARGVLKCSIELPLAVGVVGGATTAHPAARTNLKLLGAFGKSSQKLAALMASVGLAQNMGAMRALASEGIQKGHMALHRRKRDLIHAHRL